MTRSESIASVFSDSTQKSVGSRRAQWGMVHRRISNTKGLNESSVDTPSPPVASLLPWRSSGSKTQSESESESKSESDIEIKLYIVTGYHGKLKIPESFCRECNLFVRAADAAAAQVDADVRVSVVSWWTHFLFALRYGGYHPPIIVVGGTRLSQGHQVPTTQEIVKAIQESLNR